MCLHIAVPEPLHPGLGVGEPCSRRAGLVAGMQMSWGSGHGIEECWGPRSPTHTPGNPDQDGSTGSWAQCPPCPLAGVGLALERCLRYGVRVGGGRAALTPGCGMGTWEKVVPVPGWATAPRPAGTPPLQPPPQPLVITLATDCAPWLDTGG